VVKAPGWFKTDDVGRCMAGVVGEMILLREMRRRGLLAKRESSIYWWVGPAESRDDGLLPGFGHSILLGSTHIVI
jgi:hypothetical protein